MRLGTRSLWLLLALLVVTPSSARPDDPPSDGPDGLKPLTEYWKKDRPGGGGGRGAVVEGNTIRVKPGQLIKLMPEDDWPAEVEWDWPESLVSRDETNLYHIDDARRVLILPSDRPGQYRVTAWGFDKGKGNVLPEAPPKPATEPAKPAEPAKPGEAAKPAEPAKPGEAAKPAAPGGKPRRLKVWTVIVEGAKPAEDGAAKDKVTEKERPASVPDVKTIKAAVAEDLKDASSKPALADLQTAFDKLAKEAESGTKWKYSGDANKEINDVMKAVNQSKLPQTYKVVRNRILNDPDIKTYSGPATRWDFSPKPRKAYSTVLREIANALK